MVFPTWCNPIRLHGFRSTVSWMLFWREVSAMELSDIFREFLVSKRLKRRDISLSSIPSSLMYSESSNILCSFHSFNYHARSCLQTSRLPSRSVVGAETVSIRKNTKVFFYKITIEIVCRSGGSHKLHDKCRSFPWQLNSNLKMTYCNGKTVISL